MTACAVANPLWGKLLKPFHQTAVLMRKQPGCFAPAFDSVCSVKYRMPGHSNAGSQQCRVTAIAKARVLR